MDKKQIDLEIMQAALEKIRDWEYSKRCCDILRGFAKKALKEIEK